MSQRVMRIRSHNSPKRSATHAVQRPCRPSRLCRYGSSLIEVTVLISLVGSVALLTIQSIRNSTRSHEYALDTVVRLQQLDRSLRQLESDVGRANRVQVTGDGKSFTLTLFDDRLVTYSQSDATHIQRLVQQGTETIARDSLALASPFSWLIYVYRPGSPGQAAATLDKATLQDAPLVDISIRGDRTEFSPPSTTRFVRRLGSEVFRLAQEPTGGAATSSKPGANP